jgi:2-haloacid dehalogenase
VKPVRVLLFDVFGTLVDWRASLIDLAEATALGAGAQPDWGAVVDDWRRAYQPAMDRVRDGAAWRDLDSL